MIILFYMLTSLAERKGLPPVAGAAAGLAAAATVGAAFTSSTSSPGSTVSSSSECAGPVVDMEGPAVDGTPYEDLCVEDDSDGNLHSDMVSEGKVANVNDDGTSYQDPESSPDWSVCLNIDSSDGCEWYSLDSTDAHQYLRDDGSHLVDNSWSSVESADTDDIQYYWRPLRNPYHPDYNNITDGEANLGSEIDSWGLAIEEDYDEELEHPKNTVNDQEQFYSFQEIQKHGNEVVRDKDYDPQGDVDGGDEGFDPVRHGYSDRLFENTRQLEPGMQTSVFGMMDDEDELNESLSKWDDSLGTEDRANQWMVTSDPTKCVTARGNAAEPGESVTREEWETEIDERSTPIDETIPKESQALGNSLCVVAAESFETYHDEIGIESQEVPEGYGVWVSADDVRKLAEDDKIQLGGEWSDGNYIEDDVTENWTEFFKWSEIDLTGPSRGFGFRHNDMSPDDETETIGRFDDGEFITKDEGNVVIGDIYFEGSYDDGQSVDEINPPACGDDQTEYLIEEVGDIGDSEFDTGHYACGTEPDQCVSMGVEPRVHDYGDYAWTDKETEFTGRLQQSERWCGQVTEDHDLFTESDDLSKWYNQDFGWVEDGEMNICRENDLWGDEAKRWINDSYVEQHPYAVTGGLDDSMNDHLQNLHDEDVFRPDSDLLESDPELDYDSSVYDNATDYVQSEPVTPVQTPVDSDGERGKAATQGFCAGDDDSEYVITQECNTPLCEDNRSVLGVADEPTQCVLDNSHYEETDDEWRRLYETGENVTFDLGESERTVSCYDGAWYDEYPLFLPRNSLELGSGMTQTFDVQVVNPTNTMRTVRLSSDDDFEEQSGPSSFTTFVEDDAPVQDVEIPPQTREMHTVEVYGGNTDLEDAELMIEGQISGTDFENNQSINVTVSDHEPVEGVQREVSGLNLIQIVLVAMFATALLVILARTRQD